MEAIHKAGFEGKMKLAMDVAASELYVPKTGNYDLNFKVQVRTPRATCSDADGAVPSTREDTSPAARSLADARVNLPAHVTSRAAQRRQGGPDGPCAG